MHNHFVSLKRFLALPMYRSGAVFGVHHGWRVKRFHPASLVLLLLLFTLPAHAQDTPTSAPITVGTPISDSITEAASFDIWEFSPVQGEQYRAEMQAAEGLAPLLGLRAPSGDIIVASNQFEDGSTQDAQPNDLVTLFFEIPTAGDYALVATRVGTNNGTTQGSYTLTLTLIAAAPVQEDTYIDVTFRCGVASVTTAVVLQFGDQTEQNSDYQITVYGFGGFDPVIRLGGDDGSADALCEMPAPPDDEPAFEFGLGGLGDFTFTAADITGVAQLDVSLEQPEPLRITIGSRDGAPGQFALHITGLAIESAGDWDVVTLRSGPFAKDELVTLWMLRDGLSRLDPILAVPEEVSHCVDLGLRSCAADLPGAGIRLLSNGVVRLTSDRLDAVAQIEGSGSDLIELTAASQNPRTTGAYMLWLFGALPAVP